MSFICLAIVERRQPSIRHLLLINLALATLSKQQEASPLNPESLHVDEPDAFKPDLLPTHDSGKSEASSQPRFILDWIALAGLIGLIGFAGWWIDKHFD